MSHYADNYEFGPYQFDLARRVLTRAGESISLTPKATEILVLLLANAGQVVAVLSFLSATDHSISTLLTNGITQTLINLLRMSQVRLMSQSAVDRYGVKAVNPHKEGRELFANEVLSGWLNATVGKLKGCSELLNQINCSRAFRNASRASAK